MLIIRLAAKPPRRWRPLSSNVRPHGTADRGCTIARRRQQFFAFLRDSAEISIYRSWSRTVEPVHAFDLAPEASPFYLHKRAFPWEPEFERVAYSDKDSGQAGTYFRLANTSGPLLEYSRHPIQASSPQVAGRVYWSKYFVEPKHEVQYDIALFAAWYAQVASWLRKHGKRVAHGNTKPWCLPGALRLLGE